MDHYKETLETWNKGATLYQEKFMDLDIYNETYDFFSNCIKNENAKVLDIGCGPGNITKYLLKKRSRFQIEGIDVAPKMVELAKQNNPNANFRILDSRNISTLESKYDGIVCGFCLPYLSEKDAEKLVLDIFQLLINNGYLYLSFVDGDSANSGFQVNSIGDRCYFQYYPLEYITQTLLNGGFSTVKVFNIRFPKSENIEEIHTVVISKKEDNV